MLIETRAGVRLPREFGKVLGKKRIRSILASWLFLMVISIPVNTIEKNLIDFLSVPRIPAWVIQLRGHKLNDQGSKVGFGSKRRLRASGLR